MTADTSNTYGNKISTELSAEQIARSVQITRAALDQGADELPYEISERLRAIRVRALAQAKQAPVPTTQHSKTATSSKWHHQLVGWLKGGIAVSAFALALAISVVSIRSELTTDVAVSDRAISMSNSTSNAANEQIAARSESDTATHSANAAISTGKNTTNASNTLLSMSSHTRTGAAHPPERNPAVENIAYGRANAAMSARPTSAPAATVAHAELANPAATAPQAIQTSAVEDDEIAMVLHEQIPLQAYLNDDFARFANHEGLSHIEKLSNTTSNNQTPNE